MSPLVAPQEGPAAPWRSTKGQSSRLGRHLLPTEFDLERTAGFA